MTCQTSFVALNIEPESDSEDEIDDSKEIQVGLSIYRTNTCRIMPYHYADRRGLKALPECTQTTFSRT